MSFSSQRRDALDAERPLAHRASHARSCAVRVAEKHRVHRDLVIEAVWSRCGVDLTAPKSHEEIQTAVQVLDDLWQNGLRGESA